MLFNNPTLSFVLVLLLIVFIFVFALRSTARDTRQMVQRVARQQSAIRQYDDVRLLCRAIHYLQPTTHTGIDYIVSKGGPEQKPYIEKWFSSIVRQPTPEELEQAMKAVSGIDPAKDHAVQRLKEYPSVGDQLDAAYKARQGDHSEQMRLDHQISMIKEKYPKSDDSL